MKSQHVTWVCVLGASTVVGLLLGSIATKRLDSARSQVRRVEAETPAAVPRAPLPSVESPVVRTAEMEADEPSDEAPAVLPHDDAATPIDPRREQLLREIIAREMPDASPEDREIWFEAYKGGGPEELLQVLRIRKSLGSIVPAPESLPAAPTLDPELVTRPSSPVPHADVPSPEIGPAPSSSRRSEQFAPDLSQAHLPSSVDAGPLEAALVAIGQAERVVLDNVANANTRGFRRRQPILADLGYVEVLSLGPNDSRREPGRLTHLGNGCRLLATRVDARSGPLFETGSPFDVAIVGRGLLQVVVDDEVLYGRNGTLRIDADGRLTLVSGPPIEPEITVPADAVEIVIDASGTVSAGVAASTEAVHVGQLQLARFTNPDGLAPRDDGLLAATEASGPPTIDTPGADGSGTIRQGWIEGSNVDLERELREFDRLREHGNVVRELLRRFPDREPRARLAEPPADEWNEVRVPGDGGPILTQQPHSPRR